MLARGALLVAAAAVGCSAAATVWEIPKANASIWSSLERTGFDVVKGEQWAGGRALVASSPAVLAEAEANHPHVAFHLVATPAAVPTGYKSLDAIHAELHKIAEAYPEVAAVVDLSEKFARGETTAEGRTILGLKISDNVAEDEDEPNVLIVAAHHCREIVTPEMALGAIRMLLDPAHREEVAAFQTWVIPVVNVDGYNYVFETEPMWRKNRRVLPSGDVGVDLNRNYLMGWNGGCGGSTSPGSDTYRGPSAQSEAEVKLIVRMSEELRFERVMDFHSSGREVLSGYKCTLMPRELNDLIDEHATDLARAANYAVRLPSNEGEHQTDQLAFTTAFAYLTETATQFQPPHTSALEEVKRVLPLLELFYSTRVPVRGHVTDSVTEAPIPARILRTAWEGQFVAGETRHAEKVFGGFSLWLPAGEWQLEFVAPGYQNLRTTVRVVQDETIDLEMRMHSEQVEK